MDIAKIGAELLKQKLGLSGSIGDIAGALVKLLGGGKSGIDLKSLVASFQGNSQLSGLVSSWLGDGSNSAISAASILSVLGDSKVASFASSLGIGKDTAAEGLSSIIPSMIDKASSGGNLLENLGGASGALGALKSFFK